MPGASAAFDGFRPGLVQRQLVPLLDLLKVRARGVEIDLCPLTHVVGLVVAGLDEDQGVALGQRVADLGVHLSDHAADTRGDDVLHLHGLHDHQRLTPLHLITDPDGDLDDRALDRGERCTRALGALLLRHHAGLLRVDPSVFEHSQWVG